MTTSDIITLISLIIAIYAIINEKNRKHLLLKFYLLDYLIFILAFFLINYFVFYKSFYNHNLYLTTAYFKSFGFKDPNKYAYILSIISLLYFFYKIQFSYYHYSKKENVIKFYKTLIEKNEILFLLDLIERYHKEDIINSFRGTKKNDEEENDEDFLFENDEDTENLTKKFKVKIIYIYRTYYPFSCFSRYNKKSYAISVLNIIINDPSFIVLASNLRPYFFAEIFKEFNKDKKNSFPVGLLNSFLSELLQNKNFWLEKELKESEKHEDGQPKWFYNENKILSVLLQDLSVSDINEIWFPFSTVAIAEIEEERSKGYESKMFLEYIDKNTLWQFKTTYTIQLFKILIIETIIKKYDCHFFLSYYNSITDAILKTFEKYPPKDFEKTESNYHKYIELMKDNMFLWLDISIKKNDDFLYENILNSLGNMIHSICSSPYYGEERLNSIIKKVLVKYCSLKLNSQTIRIMQKLDEIILKPTKWTDDNHPYYLSLKKVWDEFNQTPYQNNLGDNDNLKQLKTNIIIPLNIL